MTALVIGVMLAIIIAGGFAIVFLLSEKEDVRNKPRIQHHLDYDPLAEWIKTKRKRRQLEHDSWDREFK